MNGKMTRKLTESAVFIALGTILSILKIDLPFGGGVTIASMLPLVLISHRWGWKWGVLTAFVYSVIQMFLGLDNVGYATSFVMALGVALSCLSKRLSKGSEGRQMALKFGGVLIVAAGALITMKIIG